MVTAGFRSLSAMPTPASVPPVPTAQTKPSTAPSVCSQISGPVGAPIGDVVELLGPDRAVGLGRGQLVCETPGEVDVVAWILVRDGGHLAHVGTAKAKHVLLFLALGLGNDDDGAVAKRVADQRQPDAGVPGGALDDHPAGLQEAAFLGVADDVKSGAVLDRASGVEELGLAEYLATRRLGRRGQADQRRVADGPEKSVANVYGAVLISFPRGCANVGATGHGSPGTTAAR